jgi:hypothetical protein
MYTTELPRIQQELIDKGYTWHGWENDRDFVKPEYASSNLTSWTDGYGHTIYTDHTQEIYWGVDSSD